MGTLKRLSYGIAPSIAKSVAANESIAVIEESTFFMTVKSNSEPAFTDVAGGTLKVKSVGGIDYEVSSPDPITTFRFGGTKTDVLEVNLVRADDLNSLLRTFDELTSMTKYEQTFSVTENVTSFFGTWHKCKSLISFPLIDTSKGTTFLACWTDNLKLTSFPLLDFSLGVNFKSTFRACKELISLPALDFSSGEIFEDTFSGQGQSEFYDMKLQCIAGTLDFSNLTNGLLTFIMCTALVQPPIDSAVRSSGNGDYALAGTWTNPNPMCPMPPFYMTVKSNSAPEFSDVAGGKLTVELISGNDYKVYSNDSITTFRFAGTKEDVLEVNLVSGDDLTSLSSTFYQLTNLTKYEQSFSVTENVTDFNGAWGVCSKLTSFPLIDTSEGTNFNGTFMENLELLSLPAMDYSKGTNFELFVGGVMGSMKIKCIAGTLNFSSLLNGNGAFLECPDLVQPPIDSAVRTSNGNSGLAGTWTNPNMCPMPAEPFYMLVKSNSAPEFSDVAGGDLIVEHLGGVDYQVYSLDAITTFRFAGTKADVLEVNLVNGDDLTSLSGTFRDLINMTKYEQTFSVTENVTGFSFAWKSCIGLTSFPLIDTSSGTNFTYAWHNCSSLTSFPLIDTSSGTNFSQAWYSCRALTSFPLIDTSSGTKFDSSWKSCIGLTSFPLINTSSGTGFQSAWYNCIGLTSFPLIDTSNGTNFRYAWGSCTGLTSFPLIDTSSGTIFSIAWSNCLELTSFPLIDTSSGTDFGAAWQNCSGLTSFPLIDTSSGTNFPDAWNNCSGLICFKELDFSNLTNGDSAFKSCPDLIQPPIGTAVRDGDDALAGTWTNPNMCPMPAEPFYMLVKSNSAPAFTEVAGGTLTVELISGNDYRVYSNDSITTFQFAGTKADVLEVNLVRADDLNSLYVSFKDLVNMTKYEQTFSVTENVTDFYAAWANNKSLISFPSIDTSEGLNFSFFIDGAGELLSLPELDYSKGTNFDFMLGYPGISVAMKLKCIAGTVDFSSLTDGGSTFSNGPVLIQPAPDSTIRDSGDNGLAGTWTNPGPCPAEGVQIGHCKDSIGGLTAKHYKLDGELIMDCKIFKT